MDDKPPRRWFQVHLSTFIVLVAVTGALLIASALDQYPSSRPAYHISYGWPYHYRHDYHAYPINDVWYPKWLMIDIAYGLFIIVAAGILSEWARRRCATILDCQIRLRPTMFAVSLTSVALLYFNLCDDYDGEYVNYGWPNHCLYLDDHGVGEIWVNSKAAWNVYVALLCIVMSSYLANRVTRNRPHRPLQFHLSTYLMLTLLSGFYLLLNLSETVSLNHVLVYGLRPATKVFGWPYKLWPNLDRFRYLNGIYAEVWLPRLCIALNVLILISISLVLIEVSEWLTHRRENCQRAANSGASNSLL